jgi:hypothetical protein
MLYCLLVVQSLDGNGLLWVTSTIRHNPEILRNIICLSWSNVKWGKAHL